jgi:hypothetical protein
MTVRSHFAERPRRVALDRREQLAESLRGERTVPGEHLVEHDPDREDVAGRADLRARGLLRRHVPRRAEKVPFERDERLGLASLEGGRIDRALVLTQLREPEVEDLRLTVGVEHDVLRLEVAVDDAFGVAGVDAILSTKVRRRPHGSRRADV